MRRRILALFLGSMLALQLASIALAAKPDTFRCPAEASGWLRVDAAGWWERTVAGFAVAGIHVYEDDGTTFTEEFEDLAVAFGFASAADLMNFVVVDQFPTLDINGNGYVCMRDVPINPQNPGYYFRPLDDRVPVR